MQINGIGGNHSDMHHVTNCIHDHKQSLEGQLGVKAAAAQQAAKATSQQAKEPFSLLDWLRNAFGGTPKLFGKFGIGGVATGQISLDGAQAENGAGEAVGQGKRIIGESSLVQEEALAAALVQPRHTVNNNPYFAAITEDTTSQHTPLQKMKIRFRDITGFMARKFSFTNGENFQARQERPKEDLRRRSNYRKDDVELECVITDDSYLMDSYNRKGEYSKLSTDK